MYACLQSIDRLNSPTSSQLLSVELADQAAGRRRLRVVDCGAGVGRVTKELLIHKFADVDLVGAGR